MKSNLSELEVASRVTSWPGGPPLTTGLMASAATTGPNLPVFPWALPFCSSMIFSIFAVGTAANALVLFVTVQKYLLERSSGGGSGGGATAGTTTVPILSLSAADSLVMLALPPWGLYVAGGYSWPPAAASLCRASSLSLLVGLLASALTLSWISVERCAAVLAPGSVGLLRSPRVSAAGLCVSWLPSAALGALLTADVSAYSRGSGSGGGGNSSDDGGGGGGGGGGRGATACGYRDDDKFTMWSLGNRPGHGVLLNVVGFVLPFAVLSAAYGAVCHRVCALSRFGDSRIPADSVLRLLFALTVVFCVTWCPYTVANLYSGTRGGGGGGTPGDGERVGNTVGELCMVMGLNSALNPLLYCLWSRRNWRRPLLLLLTCGPSRPARVGASA